MSVFTDVVPWWKEGQTTFPSHPHEILGPGDSLRHSARLGPLSCKSLVQSLAKKSIPSFEHDSTKTGSADWVGSIHTYTQGPSLLPPQLPHCSGVGKSFSTIFLLEQGTPCALPEKNARVGVLWAPVQGQQQQVGSDNSPG